MARDHNKDNETGADTGTGNAPEVDSNTTPADGTVPVDASAAPAVIAEPKADERFKLVSTPDGKGGFTQEKRKDVIDALWTGKVTAYNPEGKKWGRGPIAKFLTKLTGKEVAYQIVFAATKGKPGGPNETVKGGEIPDVNAPAPVETPPAA